MPIYYVHNLTRLESQIPIRITPRQILFQNFKNIFWNVSNNDSMLIYFHNLTRREPTNFKFDIARTIKHQCGNVKLFRCV